MKKSIVPILIAAVAGLGTAALADEIQFTTLPQPVQTTVIRETHIAGPTGVVRVVHDPSGIYAVTVRGDAGDQIVYLNESGSIVQAPGTSTTTTVQTARPTTEQTVIQAPGTTTVQTARPAVESQQTVVTYDEVQKNQPRYELIEKKGKKEVYIDHQTGQKVTVKREND
jgi:hypothetical protein